MSNVLCSQDNVELSSIFQNCIYPILPNAREKRRTLVDEVYIC
jgi:hypothetical protein